MYTSEAINELATALAKAQGQFAPAAKDSANDAFKRGNKASKYADIAAVWEAVRKPLSDNGLCVMQQASRVEGGVAVTTQIMHASGQWVRFDPLTVPMMKQDAHGVGSATTYGRRFSLCAALGIVSDADDDGNEASGKSRGFDNDSAPANDAPEQPATTERALTKPQARPEYEKLVKEIHSQQSLQDLAQWGKRNKPRLDAMPEDWQVSLKNEYADHKHTLGEGRAA